MYGIAFMDGVNRLYGSEQSISMELVEQFAAPVMAEFSGYGIDAKLFHLVFPSGVMSSQ
jgi:hypothetical protein